MTSLWRNLRKNQQAAAFRTSSDSYLAVQNLRQFGMRRSIMEEERREVQGRALLEGPELEVDGAPYLLRWH